jgi:UV DNA damage endonuclease
MALGVCCQWLSLDSKGKQFNKTLEKTLQKGRFLERKYTAEYIESVYISNVQGQIDVVQQLAESGISVWRLSSNLLPLFVFCKQIALDSQVLSEKLTELGRIYKQNKIRVSTHPGQYTVLSSDSSSVVKNSIAELEYHAWVFDRLGLDKTHKYPINIHGGKKERSEALTSVINSLPENVKSRLTLENDERCYSVAQLLEISSKTGTPIVFDSHHHSFNEGGLSCEDAINLCNKTWKAAKPLQHISNSEPGTESLGFSERRKHSQYIHYVPAAQLVHLLSNDVDAEVEAKAKNFAVLKMSKDFGVPI